MEPLVGEGDRLIVDISRRSPATGELAVLWDGLGLVVKRVEAVSRQRPGRTPPDLRQPGLRALRRPRAGRAHGRQGRLGAQEDVSVRRRYRARPGRDPVPAAVQLLLSDAARGRGDQDEQQHPGRGLARQCRAPAEAVIPSRLALRSESG